LLHKISFSLFLSDEAAWHSLWETQCRNHSNSRLGFPVSW